MIDEIAMPTVAELNAMSYKGSSALSKGLSATWFRRVYRGSVGTPFLAWKQGETADGSISYGTLNVDSAARLVVTNFQRHYEMAPFGRNLTATATLWILPDEAELIRGDRVVLTHEKYALPRKGRFKRSAANDVPQLLPYGAVQSVENLTNAAGDVLVPFTDYAIGAQNVDGANGGNGSIKFLTDAAAVGSEFFIEWHAAPLLELDVEAERVSPIGSDDLMLPIAWVARERKGASYD